MMATASAAAPQAVQHPQPPSKSVAYPMPPSPPASDAGADDGSNPGSGWNSAAPTLVRTSRSGSSASASATEESATAVSSPQMILGGRQLTPSSKSQSAPPSPPRGAHSSNAASGSNNGNGNGNGGSGFTWGALLKRRKSANASFLSSSVPNQSSFPFSPSSPPPALPTSPPPMMTTPQPPQPTSLITSPFLRRRTLSLNASLSLSPKSTSATLAVASADAFSVDLADYVFGPIIGIGASAHVISATYRPQNNRQVAIKVVDLDRFEQAQIDELRKEVQVMTLCRHPYLLPVYQSFIATDKLYIVTPLRTAGAINYILKNHFPSGLPEQAIVTILAQVLMGMAYLHKANICHRDIKGGNILIDRETGLAQLGDFGVSSSLCEGVHRATRKSFVGSVLWMAPEVMEQASYNSKADIWSLGITTLEMARGQAPYSQYPPLKVCMMVLNNPPPSLDRKNAHHKYSRGFKDLIDACLMRNPALRPSAEKLLANALIKKAKKPTSLVKVLELQRLPPLEVAYAAELAALAAPNGAGEGSVSLWDFDSPTVGHGNDRPEFSVVPRALDEEEEGRDRVNFAAIPVPPIPEEEVELRPGPRPRANSAMDIFRMD